MTYVETHVGWLNLKHQEHMSPEERRFDIAARAARQAVSATIRITTGVGIGRSGPENSSTIQTPEGTYWWRLSTSAIPANGMPAFRENFQEAYGKVFGDGSILREESGMPTQIVDGYATALHVVPREWTRTDELWIPDAYRPAASHILPPA